MATKLKKSIKRELQSVAATKKGRICNVGEPSGRPVVAELKPGREEVISFRIKGTQIVYNFPIALAVQQAHKRFIAEKYAEKLVLYKAKRAKGIRAKKPKQPFTPYR